MMMNLVKRPLRWMAMPSAGAERLDVSARDGLRLAVHRVRQTTGGEPVMLLHGLAANRTAFHFPGRSLAEELAAAGYDCFVPELRGHGESERRGFNWDLDDYLQQDLPALIEAILEANGSDRLHWIGHSMGGVLLVCYGILRPDAPLRSGIGIGAAIDYSVGRSGFRDLLPLRPFIEHVPALPFGLVSHLLSPLLGRAPDPMTTFNVWPSNIEPENARLIYANAFHSIPISLLESLATTFEGRGLRNRDSSVFFREQAADFKVPLLLLAGTRDPQVSVEAVERTAELVGGPVRVQVFGREHGQADEYGHWDLIVGKRAPQEVWPVISSWLAEEKSLRARMTTG